MVESTVATNSAQPLITVAVPTYNQAQYLPITLDAIWFQNYPNIEIVVVNAASPDSTKQVLDDYQQNLEKERVSFARYFNEETGEVERTEHLRYPKKGRSLKVINLDSDPGLSETYNAGVQAGTGEFVAAIVSDDIPHPMMVSTLVKALESGADFAYGDALIVDDAGRVIRQFNYPDYDPQTCLADWYLMGSARMWRRSLHEKAGWYSSDYPQTQDYDLVLRFAMAGAKFVHVPQVLYSIRWHGPERRTGNHTEAAESKIFTQSKEIAVRARQWLAERGR